MEIIARVRLPLLIMTTVFMVLVETCRMYGGSVGTANSCVAFWQCYHVLATDGDTGSASGVRVFTLCVATLQHLVTSRPSLLDVSAQIQGASMPTSPHSHGLDGVAETVATAASATVSNVVGTIAEPGLQVTAMKVQWYVLLSTPRQSPHHPFLLTASTSLTSRTRRPSLNLKRIPPQRTKPFLALRRPSRVCGSPLQHLSSPEAPRRVTGARARTRLAQPVDTTQIRARPRGPGDSTRDDSYRLTLTATLSFLLNPDPFVANSACVTDRLDITLVVWHVSACI